MFSTEAAHLQKIRNISKFTNPDDLIFINQLRGKPFSERIWKDGLYEMLVEARLADWAPDDSNNARKVKVHSGKNLTWYSFRHTHITFRLNAGTPIPIIASNCNTSMKYIEDHYYHYRTAEQTDALGKGRKILPRAKEHLGWVDELFTAETTSV